MLLVVLSVEPGASAGAAALFVALLELDMLLIFSQSSSQQLWDEGTWG